MLRHHFLLVGLVILVSGQAIFAEDPVYFEDATLKQAVIDYLAGLDPPTVTSAPTPTDMLKIGNFRLGILGYSTEFGNPISSTIGLEYALNMKWLEAGSQTIENLAGLSGSQGPLSHLARLNVAGCVGIDISLISSSSMPALEELTISTCGLGDNDLSNLSSFWQYAYIPLDWG